MHRIMAGGGGGGGGFGGGGGGGGARGGNVYACTMSIHNLCLTSLYYSEYSD